MLAVEFSLEPVFVCDEPAWRQPIRATERHRFESLLGSGPFEWIFAGEIGVCDGLAMVAKIQTTAGTYVAAGVLCHNLKMV